MDLGSAPALGSCRSSVSGPRCLPAIPSFPPPYPRLRPLPSQSPFPEEHLTAGHGGYSVLPTSPLGAPAGGSVPPALREGAHQAGPTVRGGDRVQWILHVPRTSLGRAGGSAWPFLPARCHPCSAGVGVRRARLPKGGQERCAVSGPGGSCGPGGVPDSETSAPAGVERQGLLPPDACRQPHALRRPTPHWLGSLGGCLLVTLGRALESSTPSGPGPVLADRGVPGRPVQPGK